MIVHTRKLWATSLCHSLVPHTYVELYPHDIEPTIFDATFSPLSYFCIMYSKQEASLLNQQFWTALGKYMLPIPSAEGEKINWINYKTGEKNIRFVMEAENKIAKISIQLSHTDIAEQQFYFEKFAQLKKIFEQAVGKDWQWLALIENEHGKTISQISTKQNGLNILNKTDWPALISFFKKNLVALDTFWCENKFAFER